MTSVCMPSAPAMAHLTLATPDLSTIMEDSFAYYVRNPRTSRSITTPIPPPGISPSLYGVGVSPRLPSALPPTASPPIEPATLDTQHVLPFYSSEDELERETERRRRVDWTHNNPAKLRTRALPAVDVVDDAVAERVFSNLPSRYSDAAHSQHPIMLELPPLQPSQSPPVSQPPWRSSHPPSSAPSQPPMSLSNSKPSSASNPLEFNLFTPSSHSFTHHTPTATPSPPPPPQHPLTSPFSLSCDGLYTNRRRRPSVPSVSNPSSTHSQPLLPHTSALPLLPPPPPPSSVLLSSASASASAPADQTRCHLCNGSFARRSNLLKHMRSVHETMRKFSCTSCPRKFKRHDHLLKHQRSVHHKLKSFTCEICGALFAEKFNRDKHHRSIHETERPFRCPCGAYFQDRERMNKCVRCRKS